MSGTCSIALLVSHSLLRPTPIIGTAHIVTVGHRSINRLPYAIVTYGTDLAHATQKLG